jgi:hypothetical protein
MRRVAMAGTVLLWLLSVGCGGSPGAPTPTASDSMNSITNVNPPTGTTLHPGQTVTFTGTAGYTLATADQGSVVMVIQDQANRALPTSDGQKSAVVPRGSGNVTISQTITVPDDGVTSVRIFFALAAAGTTTTNAVLSVAYQVR